MNITIPGGTTKRLLTAGKYCPSDILVTAEGSVSRLPEGYTELEYIESSGTQYADTGFTANQNTSATIKFSTTQQSNGGILVAMQGWRNRGFGIFVNAIIFGSSTTDRTGMFGDGNIHEVTLTSGAKCYDNGSLIWSGTASTFTTPATLTICKSNVVSEAHEYSSAKIYSCQIYDNGTLVRDYVPCRNPYGVVGLYDLVNCQFYGNAGTGEFYGVAARTLPTGYTKLNYIQSSGTQYINTGLSISSSTYSKYRFVQEVLYPLGGSFYFVNGHSGSGVVYYFGCTPSGAVVYGNGTSDKTTSYSTTANKKIIIDFNASGGMYTFDGNETALSLSAPSGTKNFFLFGYGITSQLHTERLYSFQAYLGGVLVRDYVPCTNPSGVYGLYDFVNGVFYQNAGSGSFTGG